MYTLVDGVTYLVADDASNAGGLYHGDTRHLLPLSVTVEDVDLTLVDDDRRPPSARTRRFANAGSSINEIADSESSKHATVAFVREQTVSEGRLVERFELRNHRPRERTFDVALDFGADFADIFEVRGIRETVSRDAAVDAEERTVTYSYDYADDAGATRAVETAVTVDAEPTTLDPASATFEPTLGPQERWGVTVEVVPTGESSVRAASPPDDSSGAADIDGRSPSSPHSTPAREDADGRSPSSPRSSLSHEDADERRVDPFVVDEPIATGDGDYDRTFAQARRDVQALTTRSEHGPVPLAGAPWFVTVFGRDSLLASYLLLPVAPALARASLRYLAARQGTRRDDRRDELPGKILHEVRNGELARTDAIPQTPYYGTVDATPLWVILLHETWRWTGDDDLVTELWENLEAALDWIESEVAAVGENPFLYYRELGLCGVSHKVWRDAANGVQFADGTSASPPLASAAVQGYVYDALTGAAELATDVRGDDELATELAERAATLRDAFDDRFWMSDRGCYAAALTTDERRVDSITSTVGHCLWSGIVPPERADEVADRLLEPDVFSGWGLRTLSAGDDGFSPISYHAGGVWPHDNALVTLGLARYGRYDAAETVAASQLDALSHLDDHSAPELFCGFDDSTPPATYPSACRPQVWAAAAPFGYLRALFDLEPDGGGPPSTRRSDVLSREAIEAITAYWE